jgi:hypothetical protein
MVILLMGALLFSAAGPVLASELQIDNFDDIANSDPSWTVWPATKTSVAEATMRQGTSPGDAVYEGTGSLVGDYTPYVHNTDSAAYYFTKTYAVGIDLSPSAIGATSSTTAISIQQWLGQSTLTARLSSITFETSHENDFTYAPQPWNYTQPMGWNQVTIAQSDFVVNGVPDWANITKITIQATAYDAASPTDVAFDDLRLIEIAAPIPGQIDTFDDLNSWSVYPAEKVSVVEPTVRQGSDSVPNVVQEGTGSLIADFTPYVHNTDPANYYISKIVTSLDLSPASIGVDPNTSGAAISLWQWLGKSTLTGRLTSIIFETSYQNDFTYALQPWNYTKPAGWHEVFITQAEFVVNGTPDWSDINKITLIASAYNETNPEDVIFDDLRLVEYVLPAPDVIDSFDDISGWNVYPTSAGGIIQGAGSDPNNILREGTGSMIVDHTPYPGFHNYNLNKQVVIDLSPSVIGATDAAISLWMWIGKDTPTARLDMLTFETSYDNHFSYDPQPWNYTKPIGWYNFVIPQADFTVTGTADWSNITNIKIDTSSYNDETPTDVIFDDMRLVETTPPELDQIESFDDIGSTGLSVWPDNGWVVQGTAPGDPVYEGDGSLRVAYEGNFDPDPNGELSDPSSFFNWYPSIPLDLSGSVIGGDPNNTAISFWMWVGKDTLTARVVEVKFSTAYYNSEFEYIFPDTTYDIGWNQVVIPLNDFGTSSSTITDPTWSSIEYIAIHTSSDPDDTPTDVLIDDMRLIAYTPKCNKYDRDGDCEYNLYDFALENLCWLIDCTLTPGDACCVANCNIMDLDGDCDYDVNDLALEATGWLVDCSPGGTSADPSCE